MYNSLFGMGLIGNSSIVQKLEREKEKLKEKKMISMGLVLNDEARYEQIEIIQNIEDDDRRNKVEEFFDKADIYEVDDELGSVLYIWKDVDNKKGFTEGNEVINQIMDETDISNFFYIEGENSNNFISRGIYFGSFLVDWYGDELSWENSTEY